MRAELVDTFGRSFKTLRVSLTNTCNLGCVYCVDPSDTHVPLSSKKAVAQQLRKTPLQVSQFVRIIQKLHDLLDFETLRLTGGEPTLYRELIPLVTGIQSIGIPQIKMTSNGYLLGSKVDALKNAGLSSVNISLDAIEEDVFFTVSKRRNLGKILDGIEKCVRAGIEVKINAVIMKGVNESQISKLLRFSRERGISIRFLELMQMGHLHGNFDGYFFSEKAILDTISREFDCIPLNRDPSATSKYWMLADGYKFGIISNESDPFCNDCNRLRLDSYGHIFGCLSDNTAISLADCLDDEEEMIRRLQKALLQKKMQFRGSALSMLHIGG